MGLKSSLWFWFSIYLFFPNSVRIPAVDQTKDLSNTPHLILRKCFIHLLNTHIPEIHIFFFLLKEISQWIRGIDALSDKMTQA